MPTEFVERQKGQYFYEITSLGGNLIFFFTALLFLILKNYNVFKKLLLGIILIYAVVIFIKIFYFKNRPKKYNYNSFIEKIDASSFPSVHSARSAFLALALADYFNITLVSVLLIIPVILVAYSRIYLKKHDLKDVLGGITLGILAYFFITFIY